MNKLIFQLLVGLLFLCFVNYANAGLTVIGAINKVENSIGGRVGVSILHKTSGQLWSYNGDVRFPLMSTFKTFACGALLFKSQNKELSLDQSVLLTRDALLAYSPVTKNYINKRISLEQACSAAMLTSDNTAANIVLKTLGGPTKVTEFMRLLGDETTRLNRIEPNLNTALKNDVRDTTTPNAAAKSLRNLLFVGATLSKKNRSQLLFWMQENRVSDDLLRSVLPENWRIADRSGAGDFGSRAINALVWTEAGESFVVSIYLTQTHGTMHELNQAIALIGKAIFEQYR
ncbi:UNVERIFIED_CONTAM: hypothetical protein GTU68_008806 [Idotea baltica]|nr:hypothetical protein [Idotea baltica]